MIVFPASIEINKIENSFLTKHNIELYLQREDLIHPTISGNKWRKLKYNLEEFKRGNYNALLTFGGAFSNHIAATAAAGNKFSIPTIGIIRGEKSSEDNPTLSLAKKNGMHLHFVDRTAYQNKTSDEFLNLIQDKFPNTLIIPEGGANENGLKGCAEITNTFQNFDSVFCACGTGTTLAGIITNLKAHQNAVGIGVLKNSSFLTQEIQTFLDSTKCTLKNWEVNYNYHLGGYAKNSADLNLFISQFYKDNKIKLDPIYTGKMIYAIYDLIKIGKLKNCRILAIHTGGLQGIKGYESRYKTVLFNDF